MCLFAGAAPLGDQLGLQMAISGLADGNLGLQMTISGSR